jgi:hypothetical protein
VTMFTAQFLPEVRWEAAHSCRRSSGYKASRRAHNPAIG